MSSKNSPSDEAKRKSGNRGVRVACWLTDDLSEAFEAWKGSFEFAPTDSDVIRQFVKEALMKRGFWPLKKEEGIANKQTENGTHEQNKTT